MMSVSISGNGSIQRTLPCPNCGDQFEIPVGKPLFNCHKCREALLLSADGKVVLANPIRTYLELKEQTEVQSPDGEAHSSAASDGVVPISARRQKKHIQLAYERIVQEKQLTARAFGSGVLSMILGGLLLLLMWIRIQFSYVGWMSFAFLAFGLVLVIIGAYMTLWFHRAMRSVAESEKDTEEERRLLGS